MLITYKSTKQVIISNCVRIILHTGRYLFSTQRVFYVRACILFYTCGYFLIFL